MLQASSLAKEGRFTASKWLKVPVLLEIEEMECLLEELGEGVFYLTSGVVEDGIISYGKFLASYRSYVEKLRGGLLPDIEETRSLFSSVWSAFPDCLYTQEVGEKKHLIRVRKPVIQLRPHGIHYSPLDGKVRSMTPGISWGVEFSYPTLMQDPITGQIKKVDEAFVNTAPFKVLQRWIRRATLPVPFLVEGRKLNVPIRLGKLCFSWINRHPQLGNLEVAV